TGPVQSTTVCFYSATTPAALITAAHLATSPSSQAVSSAGERNASVMPCAAMAFAAGSVVRPADTALYSLSIVAAGVFAGANSANQASASTPATPDSASVGRCGRRAARSALATPSARSAPA